MEEEEKTKEQLVNELEVLRQQVAELETFDGLTRIHNQRYFEERLGEKVARSSRYAQEFSFIMFNVDNFDMYSNYSGQAAGDEVLKLVGQAFHDCIRQKVDIACRYSGSKFAAILPHTSSSGAKVVAERLRQDIERVLTLKSMFGGIKLTINLGIASFPIDELSQEGLIRRADAALVEAKQRGGNQVCLASDVPSPTHTEEKNVAGVAENLSESGVNVIYTMAAAVDARNRYTYTHSQKVAKHSMAIGGVLNLSGRQIRHLRTAAVLHDIGKIGIPDSIIRKPSHLNEEEQGIMQKHPELGATIVSQIPELDYCAPAIRHHHERYDGSGYPSGLKGEQIPLEACIIAVAEASDNMTIPYPYRRALPPQEALEELRRHANTQFDPHIVLAFTKAISSKQKA